MRIGDWTDPTLVAILYGLFSVCQVQREVCYTDSVRDQCAALHGQGLPQVEKVVEHASTVKIPRVSQHADMSPGVLIHLGSVYQTLMLTL